MPHYRFTKPAQEDLESIIHHTLDRWATDQANAYIDGLEKLAKTLADTPRLAKHYREPLRVFSYQKHDLYFIEEPDGITIIRVLHANMNPSLHIK